MGASQEVAVGWEPRRVPAGRVGKNYCRDAHAIATLKIVHLSSSVKEMRSDRDQNCIFFVKVDLSLSFKDEMQF